MKIPKEWLHIGKEQLNPDQFNTITNQPLSPKPLGGIWASPYVNVGEYKSAWHQFSINIWGGSSSEGVVFTLREGTRIYTVDSQQDLISLIEEVGDATFSLFQGVQALLGGKYLDYEKAIKFYDVIYLTHKGQIETRNVFRNRDCNLYGWDVESCLILNPHVIDTQKPISIN